MAFSLGGLFSGIGKAASGLFGGAKKAVQSRPAKSTFGAGPLGLFNQIGTSGIRKVQQKAPALSNLFGAFGKTPTTSRSGGFQLASPTLSSIRPQAFANFTTRSPIGALRFPQASQNKSLLRGITSFATGGLGSLGGVAQAASSGISGKIGDKFKELLSNPENLKKLFEEGKKLFGGGGGEGAGEGGGDAPPLPDSIEDLRAKLLAQGGAGPLAPIVTEKLKELLGQSSTQVSQVEEQAVIRDLEKAEQDELDYIIDQYKNLRPGADIESDSSFRRDVGEVKEKYARLKTQALSQYRRQAQQTFDENRLRQIQLGLVGDQFTTGQLAGIGQADIDRLLSQFDTGLDRNALLRGLSGSGLLSGFRL